jgi:hypothetical protein
VALALAASVAACDVEREYDPYPIRVEISGGAVFAAADVGGGPVPVAVDVLSPITAIEVPGGGGPRQVLVDFMLHGLDPGGGTTPRSRVLELGVLDVAPCASPPCTMGGRPIAGAVGADVLSAGGRAARIDFTAGELTFFAGIAGSREERGRLCEAVVLDPFAGGGTLRVAGAEVPYLGRRPTLGACLAYDDGLAESGHDMLMALSTGIGQSVLAASAWDRLVLRSTGLLPAAQLPRGELSLTSGPVTVGIATMPHLALIGDLGNASEGRGPCRELQASRIMALPGGEGCRSPAAAGIACPCPDSDDRFCDAAGALELRNPLTVAVLDDGHPLLQSLRDELRPELAELDGILAADALAPVQLDLDYPGDRLLLRCLDPAACRARPAVLSDSAEAQRELAVCLGSDDGDGEVIE